MTAIDVAVLEFAEGGRAVWIHDKNGNTILRIQCSGRVHFNRSCTNNVAHADLNVSGNIEFCIPTKLPKTNHETRNRNSGNRARNDGKQRADQPPRR